MSQNKFKSYPETYTVFALALVVVNMYNSPSHRHKWTVMMTILITVSPYTLALFIYLWQCIVNGDVTNLTNQITVAIPFVLYFFKLFIITVDPKPYRKMLDTISVDMLKANSLDESSQNLYNHYIRYGKMAQVYWIANAALMIFIFPLSAALKMIYGYVVKLDDMKPDFMLHKVEFVYMEEKQFTSPYFEFIWLYQFYSSMLLIPSFLGYDGTFNVAVMHAALKFELVSHNLRIAFSKSKEIDEIHAAMKCAVRDHQKAVNYLDLIQSLHSGWLFMICSLTSLMLSMNLYQISVGQGIETKYATFLLCVTVHTFAPCYFSSILDEVGKKMPDALFGCGWEKWQDPKTTRMLTLMIAYAQKPLVLSAKGIFTINVELFIAIMKSAYSLYTLIRE